MTTQKCLTLFSENSITVSYTSLHFEQGDTPIHAYAQHRICILFSSGMNAIMGDKMINATSNSILFFRPEELHFGRVIKSGMHEYIDIFLPLTLPTHFHCTQVIDFLTDTSKNRINCIQFNPANQTKIQEISKSIINELLLADAKSEMRLFSLILQIILLCSDAYEAAKANPTNTKFPPFVQNTLLYISKNYTQQISLEQLAIRERCSISYLARIFKQYTGITIYQYITNLRFAHAQKLLIDGVSVTEACFASGFNDCSSFIKKFKELTNLTPKQFQALKTKNG